MPNLKKAALAAAWLVALAGLPGPARAGGVVLKHVSSVYADETGKALSRPEGVACSDDGQLVVADTGNARLVLLTFKGQAVLGGRPVTDAALRTPQVVQLDARGELVVLDARSHELLKFSPKGEPLGKLEWKGLAAGEAPVIVAFKLRAGALYLLDGAGKAVHVADYAGNVTRRLPLPAGKGPFTDLAVDGAGKIYAIDPAHATLWVADKEAKAFTAIEGGLKEVASFASQLAIDGQNNLFAVDRNGGSLAQLGLDGVFQGRHLNFGWSDGQLRYPIQICVTADFLAVADRGNNRVQVFQILR